MKIGFRTIKTALGVSMSILLAQSLQLQNFTAAGILTLLCIQRSRKQSAKAAISRFFACMAAILLSTVMFLLIGYHFYTFLIYLLLFIPLCVRFRIQEGIASSAVIVMHVYVHEKADAAFFLNEFLVVVIGLGVALLINLYMPSIDNKLKKYKEEVDRLFASILNEIAVYLKEGYTLWDGKELLLLDDTIRHAEQMALLDVENNPSRREGSFYRYFEVKRSQYEILERMLPSVSRINAKMEQGARIGDLVQELSGNWNNLTRTEYFRETLNEIRQYHKQLPLPETRHEFENRANLFAVANELERFINTL